jgi:LacI family transcriptional regulator
MPEDRRKRVGIMLSMDTEHWHGVLQGLADGFRAAPTIQVLKLSRPAKFELAALRRMKLDGLITRIVSSADEEILANAGIPVVNVSGRFAATHLTNVINDDERVGAVAAAFFRRRGYVSFGFCGVERHRSSRLRRQGFFGALRADNLVPLELILPELPEGDAPSPKAVKRLAAWMRMLPKPTAIFCFNDAIARAVAEACAEAALVIPDDVAVLGVDNDDIQLGFSAVALSSIELNRRLIGLRAAERLLEMVGESGWKHETVRVPPIKIVARGSTDKLAVNDPVVAAALDYIADRLGNAIYVEDIARETGVSRRSLEMRFRTVLNSPVYAEVQRQQLERAEVLLVENPKLTIAEVAYACGFQDARHLNVVCRRRLDRTPGSLRKG